MPPHRRRQLAGAVPRLRMSETDGRQRADVKRVQLLLKQSDETTVNVLDALIAYAQELPEALAKGRFDACKFLLSGSQVARGDSASKAVAFCSEACPDRLTRPSGSRREGSRRVVRRFA